MDQLSLRRQTYVLWPGWAPRSVNPDQLAAAGLYYSGEEDEVRCYSCREKFSGWREGDVPVDVHRRRSPGCPAVKDLDSWMSLPLKVPQKSFGEERVKLPSDVEADCGCGSTGKVRETEKGRVDVSIAAQTSRSSRSTASYTPTSLSKPDKAKLREENRRLRAELICRRCQTNKVETLFLPCRHLVACQLCSDEMDDCVKCGQKILGTVRTYLL